VKKKNPTDLIKELREQIRQRDNFIDSQEEKYDALNKRYEYCAQVVERQRTEINTLNKIIKQLENTLLKYAVSWNTIVGVISNQKLSLDLSGLSTEGKTDFQFRYDKSQIFRELSFTNETNDQAQTVRPVSDRESPSHYDQEVRQ